MANKKQYLAQVQYAGYAKGDWLNVGHLLTNTTRRYLDTQEQAEHCIQKAKEQFSKPHTQHSSCGGLGVSTHIDQATCDAFTVVAERIRVREVTDWEDVK